MNDPYRVLGVSSTATDEEVKKAYRDLARKYHPDNYHDNPLADLAQEKMKEINEAYDTVTKMRAAGQQSGGGYSGGYSAGKSGSYNSGNYKSGGYNSGSYGSTPEFIRVRQAINSGDLGTAESILRNSSVRNAEWNFLMGSLSYRKGWLDDARRYYQLAVNMDPMNAEYAQALSYMNQGGRAYNPGYNMTQQNDCDACDICTAMMCMNMCCNCR